MGKSKKRCALYLEMIASIATIAAAAVAAVALAFGFFEFRSTQSLQREAIRQQSESLRQQGESLEHQYNETAIALLLQYYDLRRELAAKPIEPESDQWAWENGHALVIAEALFDVTDGEEGWQSTVETIILDHSSYLSEGSLNCSSYSPEFVGLVERTVGRSVCK